MTRICSYLLQFNGKSWPAHFEWWESVISESQLFLEIYSWRGLLAIWSSGFHCTSILLWIKDSNIGFLQGIQVIKILKFIIIIKLHTVNLTKVSFDGIKAFFRSVIAFYNKYNIVYVEYYMPLTGSWREESSRLGSLLLLLSLLLSLSWWHSWRLGLLLESKLASLLSSSKKNSWRIWISLERFSSVGSKVPEIVPGCHQPKHFCCLPN